MLQAIILVLVLLSVANTVNMTLHERTRRVRRHAGIGTAAPISFVWPCSSRRCSDSRARCWRAIVGVAAGLAISAVGDPDAATTELGSRFHGGDTPGPVGDCRPRSRWALPGRLWQHSLPARKAARIPLVEALRQVV